MASKPNFNAFRKRVNTGNKREKRGGTCPMCPTEIWHRMSRVLVAASLLSVAVTGNSQTPNATHVKHYAIYAPRPNYPLHARQYHWTGDGLFLCNIRSDGTVASVDVLRR
jgi:hypothetical protein